MNRNVQLFFLCLVVLLFFLQPGEAFSADFQRYNTHLFEENRGQFTDMDGVPVPEVLFKTSYGNLDVYVTEYGLTYCSSALVDKENATQNNSYKVAWERVDMELHGATITKGQVVKRFPSSAKKHYYRGNFPDGLRNVESFEQVVIQDVYPGIDWVLYSDQGGGLKYDFEVAPGVDANKIELHYKSRLPLKIEENGDLTLETEHGDIKELAPISYQVSQEVATRFKENKAKFIESIGGYITEVRYDIGVYDEEQALTIDPALQWSTFVGGDTGYELAYAISSDANNNIFVVGGTSSTDFPVQDNGAYFKGERTQGNADEATLMKWSNNGELLWSTFFGGTAEYSDFKGLSIDQENNLVLVGRTSSENLPVKNAYQQDIGKEPNNSFQDDGFVVKFTNDGEILFCTYYGGAKLEFITDVATDPQNNIYITGYTTSFDLPIPTGTVSYQSNFGAGDQDNFLAKISPEGQLEWATYYDAGATETRSVVAYGSGKVLVAAPTSVTASGDLYIASFDPDGNFEWQKTIGGGAAEVVYSMIPDNDGDFYLAGATASDDFPVKEAYQSDLQGEWDITLTKLDASGNTLWSTYYGGSRFDNNHYFYSLDNLAVDSCNNVYMSFASNSPDIPVVSNCAFRYQDSTCGCAVSDIRQDLVMTQFSSDGGLLWSTYFGGEGDDYFPTSAIDVDNLGNFWVLGAVINHTGNPVAVPLKEMSGAHFDSTLGGGHDLVLAKFSKPSDLNYLVTTTPSCAPNCLGSVTVEVEGGCAPYVYQYQDQIINTDLSSYTFTDVCVGEDRVFVSNFCLSVDTLLFTVEEDTVNRVVVDTTILLCEGDSILIQGTYRTTAGTYIDTISCDTIIVNYIEMGVQSDASILTPSSSYCYVDSVIQLEALNEGGLWSGVGVTSDTLGLFDIAEADIGEHYITYTIDGQCGDSAVIQLTINRCRNVYVYLPNSFTPNGDGENDEFQPVFNDIDVLSYNLEIYSRWGEIMFDTDIITNGWDGKYNGADVAKGSYNYICAYSYDDKGTTQKRNVRGVINLLR